MQMTVAIGDEPYGKALKMACPIIDRTDFFREAVKNVVRLPAASRYHLLFQSK